MKQALRTLRSLPLCFTVLLAAGCSVNPVTERSQLMLVSENEVISGSYQAFNAMVSQANSKSRLNIDGQMTARVRDIAHRLIPHAVRYRPAVIDWQWEVHVFSDDEPNAFCMAGGKIGVNSGLITELQPTDDELAQVIGHEIAHALSEHAREKISVGIAAGLFVNVLATSQRMDTGQIAALDVLTTMAITLPNSRTAESEADKIGILLAANAGYNPDAAISLWNKMRAVSGERSTAILSTHPLPSERIASLEQEARVLRPVYLKTQPLREKDALPKINYEGGRATNLYEKGKYELPKQQVPQ